MEDIRAYALKNNMVLKELEDPWRVLNIIQEMLI